MNKFTEYCFEGFFAIFFIFAALFFAIIVVGIVNEARDYTPKTIKYCLVEKTSNSISTEYALKGIIKWRLSNKTYNVYPSAKEAFDDAKTFGCEVK